MNRLSLVEAFNGCECSGGCSREPSGKAEWQKVRHKLEEARGALDGIERIVEMLATSRKTKVRDLRKVQEQQATLMQRVADLGVIELNLRRILNIRETPRKRSKRLDS